MTELYRNDYMTVTLDGVRLTLGWTREEPGDDHAVKTADAVKKSLDAFLGEHAGEKYSVMVDLTPVKRTFPRAIASYTGWLLGHRSSIRGGAFVTKSLMLRAGISAAVLVPGLTMKGFSDLDDAKKFLTKFE